MKTLLTTLAVLLLTISASAGVTSIPAKNTASGSSSSIVGGDGAIASNEKPDRRKPLKKVRKSQKTVCIVPCC